MNLTLHLYLMFRLKDFTNTRGSNLMFSTLLPNIKCSRLILIWNSSREHTFLHQKQLRATLWPRRLLNLLMHFQRLLIMTLILKAELKLYLWKITMFLLLKSLCLRQIFQSRFHLPAQKHQVPVI